MFSSITFPKKGSGYIFKKPVRPVKPNRNDYRYNRGFDTNTMKSIFDEDKFNEDMKEYESELAWYNEHKGKFILPCAKNLVGKTFNFEDGKINLIFGPNGSGKSTIIKAIVGETLIDDGLITIHEPIHFRVFGDNFTADSIVDESNRKKMNSSEVVWDGAPVYFDNFENTFKTGYGVFGSITGSVLSDVTEEMIYRVGLSKISAGQNTTYIMNKILRICSKACSTMDIIGPKYNEYQKGNSTWKNCANAQLEYYRRHGDLDRKAPITLIFDEVDKSLDIETVWMLYTELFPGIVKATGNQIILVSHNPLVLTEQIYDNPLYNIISVDKKYTKEMKALLKDAKF